MPPYSAIRQMSDLTLTFVSFIGSCTNCSTFNIKTRRTEWLAFRSWGPYYKLFRHQNANPITIKSCSRSYDNELIATKFRIWHGICSVVTCAKICSDIQGWSCSKTIFLRSELRWKTLVHYNGVIMGTISSQITSLTIVYSIVYSYADERKHQSSVSLAFVWGIRRGPVNSPHKWPVTQKMFPFDDVIMEMDCMSNYISKTFPSWRVNTCEANHNTVNHCVLFRTTTYLHFAHVSLSSIIASGWHMTFASTDSKHNWFPDWHHNGLNKGWFYSNIHVHTRTHAHTHRDVAITVSMYYYWMRVSDDSMVSLLVWVEADSLSWQYIGITGVGMGQKDCALDCTMLNLALTSLLQNCVGRFTPLVLLSHLTLISHTLLSMWFLIHLGLKLYHVSKRAPCGIPSLWQTGSSGANYPPCRGQAVIDIFSFPWVFAL